MIKSQKDPETKERVRLRKEETQLKKRIHLVRRKKYKRRHIAFKFTSKSDEELRLINSCIRIMEAKAMSSSIKSCPRRLHGRCTLFQRDIIGGHNISSSILTSQVHVSQSTRRISSICYSRKLALLSQCLAMLIGCMKEYFYTSVSP